MEWRWVLFLHDYKLKIEYCKENENVVADTLLRMNEDGLNRAFKKFSEWQKMECREALKFNSVK